LQNIIQTLKNYSRIEYINYLILFYAFSLSFNGQTIRILAAILILVLLFDKNSLCVKFNIKTKYLILSFIIFIAFCFFSFLWSNATFKDTFDYVRKFWYLLPIITIYTYLKKDFYYKAILFFLNGMIVSSILSIGNYFNLWAVGGGHVSNPAIFTYHTHYSVILASAAIVLIINFFFEKDLKLKIFYFISSTLIITNLLINIGRTGQISLFITLIMLVIYIYRHRVRYIFVSIILMILLIIVNYSYNYQFKTRIDFINYDLKKMKDEKKYDNSLGGRVGFYIVSKEILSDNLKNLMLGVGSKQNLKASSRIIDTKYPYLFYTKTLAHFHSIYLEIITQYGLIGLFLFLAIFYNLININIKVEKIKLIYLSTISIYLLSNLVDLSLYKDIPLSIFAFLIGTSLSITKYES
jgi:O-antigen ligase